MYVVCYSEQLNMAYHVVPTTHMANKLAGITDTERQRYVGNKIDYLQNCSMELKSV